MRVVKFRVFQKQGHFTSGQENATISIENLCQTLLNFWGDFGANSLDCHVAAGALANLLVSFQSHGRGLTSVKSHR